MTEDRDFWEIALLEYYRWPLEHWREAPEEDWDQPIPACFQDLAPELPRLVECKAEVHPNDDCASVQLNLERRYGWDDFGPRNHKERRLSPQAVGSLLEYYFLVEAQGDDCGGRSCRILFEEESDTTVLERIVRHGVRTPEEQMTLALRLKEFCEGWQLEEDVEDGVPKETWESILNDDVELTVLHLGERTLEQAQDWVRAEEDDYQLVEDKQGGLGGTDTEELEMLEVRFHPSGNGMYAVLYKCPMEAIEGFGTRLSVMADTFQVME